MTAIDMCWTIKSASVLGSSRGVQMRRIAALLVWLGFFIVPYVALPADRLVGIHSARVMSQSMPWIAEEAGLFKKNDLEFPLVYIGSSPLATAAMLGGDGELLMDGGLGIVRAYVQGNTESL